MLTNEIVKDFAYTTGFSACGITSPHLLTTQTKQLNDWISKGFQGTMTYMENHHDLRENILKLYPECKSVIVLLKNYNPPTAQVLGNLPGKIATYALGDDYHFVLKSKMNELLSRFQQLDSQIDGKFFTDSAPIFERDYATLAGLGWKGKHSLLINKGMGSYFFISILLLNYPLKIDQPFVSNHCGSCSKCMDACPTQAIISDGIVDATKCISYWTIEFKEEVLPDSQQLDGWLWGCDVCQQVCPWNLKFVQPQTPVWFAPSDNLRFLTKHELNQFSVNGFRNKFRKSPFSRRGKSGLLRNISWLEKQNNCK